MSAGYEKPQVSCEDARALLDELGWEIEDINLLGGGNLNQVLSFRCGRKNYVIHFTNIHEDLPTKQYVSNLLTAQGVPYPRYFGQGKLGDLSFYVSEQMQGQVMADLTSSEKEQVLPELIDMVTRMNQCDIGETSGFGHIAGDGNGEHRSWLEHLSSFFGEDQTGDFWENWYDLFETTFLERDVFQKCYELLIKFGEYNAPYRHFVHGDLHAWNILSDGTHLTGIIDAHSLYGDFVIDIANVAGVTEGHDLIGAFCQHYHKLGIALPYFQERLLGAYFYKGLDAMRFYAKMDRERDYAQIRNHLLSLAEL